MIDEKQQPESQRTFVTEAIERDLDRFDRRIAALEAEGAPGEAFELFIGIEGREISEGALRAIFERLGVDDPRKREPERPPSDDSGIEAVFEVSTEAGIRLSLIRTRIDDGEPLVQLEAEKSGTSGVLQGM